MIQYCLVGIYILIVPNFDPEWSFVRSIDLPAPWLWKMEVQGDDPGRVYKCLFISPRTRVYGGYIYSQWGL